jgi:hypothetical protein
MNILPSVPLENLGFGFIQSSHIPNGKDEFYCRNKQFRGGNQFKPLKQEQIDVLIKNRNQADDWKNIRVSIGFNPHLVSDCQFYGRIRIGDLSPVFREYHLFKLKEGLYRSTIISSDIGHHVCMDNVHYLSHYIIGNNVMLANINEMATSDKAKFGNGMLKAGETDEKQRMMIEVCNENGGRKIIPFDGMLAGDAYLLSKFRDDAKLLQRFQEMTDREFDPQRGYYGEVGDRTVIKNTRSIKDTKIGSDAYIKGANKLKNLTINSDADRPSQIGEGCELVNGIIGYGCRIFYGVKAVRFITASHSQLKYGARLIHSYLGNNSTISCCEVLNSLIFPAHEQHHNNSFLCASLIKGQSNIAAGATIGSNHNSRSADGEIQAGRGFWPGLCVSLKHNSKFASFTILAKGDFPNELNIPLPFCLVTHDVPNDRIVVMPAYWFMYNRYALSRNAWKYRDRDQRLLRHQHIEFDFLAPDTANEIMDALPLLSKMDVDQKGQFATTGWENSSRTIQLIKVPQAIRAYQEAIICYFGHALLSMQREEKTASFDAWKKTLRIPSKRNAWINVGGQLIQQSAIDQLKTQVKSGKIKSWQQVHSFYQKQGEHYPMDKLTHATRCILDLYDIDAIELNPSFLNELLRQFIRIEQDNLSKLIDSRKKDHSNAFRQMVYDNTEEMDAVIGKFEENSFIKLEAKNWNTLQRNVKRLIKSWEL